MFPSAHQPDLHGIQQLITVCIARAAPVRAGSSMHHTQSTLDFDRAHIWHPYTSIGNPLPVYPVKRAEGCSLFLEDGRELVDGMASWWTAIFGYNHPVLNQAVTGQLEQMAHVMFGGLTHRPAVELCRRLLDICPPGLDAVFLCDSGSVSIEVAIKMAIQYWSSVGRPEKQRLAAIRSGYHGDTLGAMSVCDPVTGMHHLFSGILPAQLFADMPRSPFEGPLDHRDVQNLEALLAAHHREIAALVLEPVVQGAGGMRFYSPAYLAMARQLCDQYEVLLICDEIATGFGRTGKLFACEHAGISPDILCVGKALTGGYMTLAATLASEKVARGISSGDPGLFMHGPTFMGNPLACATAVAAIDLLHALDWHTAIAGMEARMKQELGPCADMPGVRDVRCLGGIGVVETKEPVDTARAQTLFVERGVWVRPFGRLIYIMPPYIIAPEALSRLTSAICEVAALLPDLQS